MNLKDKKLLYELDINSREKETELARKVGTSKQVINYNIKRLFNEGIIKKFQTVLNLDDLGINIYANVYFKLIGATKQKETEIINFLIKSDSVGYIASIGGRFDLSIVLVAKNLQEFENKLDKIVTSYPELRDYEISLRTFGVKFHKKYLVSKDQVKSKEILVKPTKIPKIDKIDIGILKILSQNSRISIVEISDKLKIPFSTVRVRIKSLEQKGIIAGYSILFDLSKIGFVNYKLFIKSKDKSDKTYKRMLSFVKENKNIIWFFKTIGEHDFELRIEVENQEKYQEIIKELRSEFSAEIEEIETVLIFNELKEDYSVVLENM